MVWGFFSRRTCKATISHAPKIAICLILHGGNCAKTCTCQLSIQYFHSFESSAFVHKWEMFVFFFNWNISWTVFILFGNHLCVSFSPYRQSSWTFVIISPTNAAWFPVVTYIYGEVTCFVADEVGLWHFQCSKHVRTISARACGATKLM